MKGIMVVSDSCQPCHILQEELKGLIDSGEIELISLEQAPDRAVNMMNQYQLGLPGLVIVSNNGDVIAKVV
ncbi:MAG: hypothetical protein PHC43_00070 [Candidatus Marinimicrobia bacterium]|jgi:hypothetical protein|nr:hypothetical protein [Candidatus Neomarinimicrobiota bacterium]